jgi:transposase
MAKRQFQLSEAQDHELKRAYSQCREGPTKTRYQAVRLYGIGYAVSTIEAITGCSRPSLMAWCRAYRAGGVAALVDKRQGGNRAKLAARQLEQLQAQLQQYTPRQLLGADESGGDGQFWTVPDLAKWLQREYGVCYQSRTSYRNVLARCDFTCQRPGVQYRSRNELQVLEFEQQLEKNSPTRPNRRRRR